MATSRGCSRLSLVNQDEFFEFFDELPSDGSDSEFDGYVENVEALESSNEYMSVPSPPRRRKRVGTTPFADGTD